MTIDKPPRIGVNTLFFIPGEVGGSETYLRQTLSSMAAMFPDIQMVLFANRENAIVLGEDFASHPQVKILLLKFAARNRYMRIVREQTELPIAVKRSDVDVLWSPGYTAPFYSPCPKVTSILDMQYKRHPEDLSSLARITTDLLVRWAARTSARIITISNFSRSEIARFTSAKKKTIAAIRLGVDPRFAQMSEADVRYNLISSGQVSRRPYILSVANTYPHKNMHTLVDAFAGIMDRIDHRLIVVGHPRLGEGRFQRSIAGVADPARIHRLQGVEKEQLIALYRGSDLFVFPSLYEGFGLPVLEAMMAGSPVVTTRMGSIPEIGDNHVLYADLPNSEAIGRKILEVLRWSSEYRSRWTDSAKAHAEAYSWRHTAKETLHVLWLAAGERRNACGL